MATRSDVYEMESRCRQVEAENSRMRGEIREMENSINNALNKVQSASSSAVGALKTGVTVINNDNGTLKNVSAIGKDIERKMILYKNVENAYKTIRALNNELRYRQGNEKTVRRTVTAIIDNEDKTFASEETLRAQSEKLHLETKDFFLSYIMMELELRKNGEEKAADRALAEAERMNPRKTAWVEYMIALRRGDKSERAKWLDKITCEPLVGAEKEYLKILTLLSLREQDEEAKKIAAYTGLDRMENVDKEEVAERILAKFRTAMTVVPPEFKSIKECVAESGSLNAALRGAMNNDNVVGYVQKLSMNNDEKMRNDIIIKMFDTVIETCHSPKAQKILKEIKDNEKIIEAKGVIEDAMALKAVEDVTEAADIDLEACMYEWLNDPEKYNGKRELNELSYEKYKPSYKRAYRKYVNSYRSQHKESVKVTVGEYNTTTKLDDMEKETAEIERFCKDRRDAEKAAIKDTKFILLTVFGGILLLAGIILKFIPQLGFGGQIAALVIGVVVGLALLVMGASAKYGNYRRKIKADERCARDMIAYRDKMHDVYDDMQNYREMFKEYDAKAVSDSAF